MAANQSPEQDAILGRIEDKHNESALSEYELDELVLTAHASGISWERIADRLGISRQAVTKKYSAMEQRRKSEEYNKSKGR